MGIIKGDKSMDVKLPVLKVQMLGGLSLMYGDKPISFSRNTTTKAMKLLRFFCITEKRGYPVINS